MEEKMLVLAVVIQCGYVETWHCPHKCLLCVKLFLYVSIGPLAVFRFTSFWWRETIQPSPAFVPRTKFRRTYAFQCVTVDRRHWVMQNWQHLTDGCFERTVAVGINRWHFPTPSKIAVSRVKIFKHSSGVIKTRILAFAFWKPLKSAISSQYHFRPLRFSW